MLVAGPGIVSRATVRQVGRWGWRGSGARGRPWLRRSRSGRRLRRAGGGSSAGACVVVHSAGVNLLPRSRLGSSFPRCSPDRSLCYILLEVASNVLRQNPDLCRLRHAIYLQLGRPGVPRREGVHQHATALPDLSRRPQGGAGRQRRRILIRAARDVLHHLFSVWERGAGSVPAPRG